MRTVAMCFSLLQLPRCKIQTLANSWWAGFCKLSRHGSSTRVLSADNYDLERRQRWTRQTINTETSGSKEKLTRKTSIRNEIISESNSTKLNTCKLKNIKSETDQYYNDWAKNVIAICFDIETTGLNREFDRMIEIAFRGGENSTYSDSCQSRAWSDKCTFSWHFYRHGEEIKCTQVLYKALTSRPLYKTLVFPCVLYGQEID